MYSATITGIGPDSTVPDNPGAVDAAIHFDGRCVGEVTLLPGHTGPVTTWGSMEHWASSELADHLSGRDSDDPAMIVDAVRAALAGGAGAVAADDDDDTWTRWCGRQTPADFVRSLNGDPIDSSCLEYATWAVDHLSDQGGEYTAEHTQLIASALARYIHSTLGLDDDDDGGAA